MPISFIGSANGTTSLTFPAHNIGDFLVIFAFRDGSTTNPSIGAGFTTYTNSFDGTSCSVSVGYRIATVTNTASGTWTNASRVVGLIYRGQISTTSANPIGTSAQLAGTTDPVVYTASSNIKLGGPWWIAFVGHSSVDTAVETPPTGMVLRDSSVDATCEIAAFDTNGPGNSWPTTNVTAGGTAGNWQTFMIRLDAIAATLENYKFPSCSVGNTGIMSLSEEIR